jgi:hypothetical protein
MAKLKEGYHDGFAQIHEELWQALVEDAERNARSATKPLEWILRRQYPHVTLGAEAAPIKPSKRNR